MENKYIERFHYEELLTVALLSSWPSVESWGNTRTNYNNGVNIPKNYITV